MQEKHDNARQRTKAQKIHKSWQSLKGMLVMQRLYALILSVHKLTP
jgi:hypothetical protein